MAIVSRARLSRRVEDDGFVSGYDVRVGGVLVGYVERVTHTEYRHGGHPNVRLPRTVSSWEARWPDGRSVVGDSDELRREAVATLLHHHAQTAEDAGRV